MVQKFGEREAVILAALLHDIGKVLNRVKGIRERHPVFSKKFVMQEEFIKKIKDWVNIEILITLCQRHHEYGELSDDLKVQKIGDNHLRALAYIVSRADNYSSKEREEGEQLAEDFRKTRLLSTFSKIDIGRDGVLTNKYHVLGPLTPENCFPVDDEEVAANEDAYRELVEDTSTKKSKFSRGIRLLQSRNFDHFFNGLLSIFEENFWCVPSDPRFVDNQDISLFDHLSTTSAIAACLYNYHKGDFDEEKIKNDSLEKFILVGGDLSGIQKFIFEISSTNPKKLSKILRGRSFYLSLISDCASLRILKGLDLPISCRIINAGGRFIILAPNTSETKEILKQITEEINLWFLRTFLGKLSLNIDYSVTLSGDDFSPEKFNKKLKELNQKLEEKKLKKFDKAYFSNREVDFSDIYNELTEKGTCNFCGIYPSLELEGRCKICEYSEKIGEELITRNFICFRLDNPERSSISILNVGVDFLNKVEDPTKYFLIEKIADDDEKENANFGYVRRYIANYVPKPQKGEICLTHEHSDKSQDKDCNSLCRFCRDVCRFEKDIKPGEEDRISREKVAETHLTFQCIATHTLKENSGRGVDHLAVLKADVDFLGMIFSLGIDNLSISRFATLSRMLNYFFSAVIKDLIKNKFDKIYTVYAGGDDMLLIGPWEQLIEFTIEMQDKFKKFVAENPNITISAGISLFRPHSQVKVATEIAEENLEKSKSVGKDRLTVFATTVKWADVEKLVEYKDFLDQEFKNENSKINSSFLYRLLKYQGMFIEAEDEGKIEKLIYHSLMTRDIRRNVERRDKNGNLINEDVIKKLEPLYLTIGQDKDLMRNLKIPVFWTIYKNRGGGK